MRHPKNLNVVKYVLKIRNPLYFAPLSRTEDALGSSRHRHRHHQHICANAQEVTIPSGQVLGIHLKAGFQGTRPTAYVVCTVSSVLCVHAHVCMYMCVYTHAYMYYLAFKNSQDESLRHSLAQNAYTWTLRTFGARPFFVVRAILCPIGRRQHPWSHPATCQEHSPPPPSSYDNQNYLQTMPHAPWGTQLPRAENRQAKPPKRPQTERGLTLFKAYGPWNKSSVLSQIMMTHSQNHPL